MNPILIPERILQVLQVLCPILNDARLDWAVSGSLALALYGLPVVPKDVDIQTDRIGVEQMAALLAEYLVYPPRHAPGGASGALVPGPVQGAWGLGRGDGPHGVSDPGRALEPRARLSTQAADARYLGLQTRWSRYSFCSTLPSTRASAGLPSSKPSSKPARSRASAVP